MPGFPKITDLIVPETEYENKKLSLNSHIYVMTIDGDMFHFDMLKDTEGTLVHGAPRNKDVIFKGVNVLSRGFEFVTLWKDLKCIS